MANYQLIFFDEKEQNDIQSVATDLFKICIAINNAEIQLEIAKKLAKGKGVVFLKQGYSRESEKMKAEVTARKNKKNKLAD